MESETLDTFRKWITNRERDKVKETQTTKKKDKWRIQRQVISQAALSEVSLCAAVLFYLLSIGSYKFSL